MEQREQFLSESNDFFYPSFKKLDNFFGSKCLEEEIGMKQEVLEEIQK